MDPCQLIAQCMASLPRRTYFSHPESSLDDFFAGEQNRIIGATRRGVDPSPTEQGPRLAPHEIRFLRSVRQSLGIQTHPPATNARTPEASSRRYQRRTSPSDYFSNTVDRRLSATAVGPVSSQGLRAIGIRPLPANTGGLPTSSLPRPFSASSYSPVPSASADPPAPMMPSAPHVASCRGASEPVQLQGTASAFNSSSRYQCQWEVAKERLCGEWIEGGSKEIWVHVRTRHGLKGHYGDRCRCKWDGCRENLNVSSLHRHLAMHLDIKWRCSNCDGIFARHDCVRKHIRENKKCHGAEIVSAAPDLTTEKDVAGSSASFNW